MVNKSETCVCSRVGPLVLGPGRVGNGHPLFGSGQRWLQNDKHLHACLQPGASAYICVHLASLVASHMAVTSSTESSPPYLLKISEDEVMSPPNGYSSSGSGSPVTPSTPPSLTPPPPIRPVDHHFTRHQPPLSLTSPPVQRRK